MNNSKSTRPIYLKFSGKMLCHESKIR